MTDHAGSSSSATAEPRRSVYRARALYCGFPRFDSDPVFCRLVSGQEEKGFTDVVLAGQVDTQSSYLRNTPIVTTVLTDDKGGSIRVTDFAPRFRNFDRTYRPPQLVRIIEPLSGLPRITIRHRPPTTTAIPTSPLDRQNHIRYGAADWSAPDDRAPLSNVDASRPSC